MHGVYPRLFYHLKKVIGNRLCVLEQPLISLQDLFPWIYFNYYVNLVITLSFGRRTDKCTQVKGRWFGPNGLSRPKFV